MGVWVWRFPVFLGGGQVFFIRIWGYFAQLRGGFKDLFTPHPLLLPRAPQRTPPPPHPNQAPKDPPGTLPGASICTATSVRPSSPCWVSTKTTQKPPKFTTFLLFIPIPTPKMVKIHHLFKEKKKKKAEKSPRNSAVVSPPEDSVVQEFLSTDVCYRISDKVGAPRPLFNHFPLFLAQIFPLFSGFFSFFSTYWPWR